MKNISYLFLAVLFAFASCDKEDETPAQMNVEITFENTLNGNPLELNQENFTLPSGEPFMVKKFKYYISNVVLTDTESATQYIENDSYHLLGQDFNSVIDLGMIPSANYDQITFSIGVDEVANSRTDQTGDLDPNNDMAWNWNSGYKFVVLEGEFTHQSTQERTGLIFHIGTNSNYATVTLPLSGVMAGKASSIALETAIDELFSNPNILAPSNMASTTVMGGPVADQIGQNYAEGFIKAN
ncbi:MbnP family protein [Algoriphagus vanfongensis]|uniref:MbnP family protein n=1 Tax=Algoriphagus vanfongensis TaxID=426371 RepID=UPI000425315B|nr:MbnP family protein [Algoriphagus vanfongensis]